MPGWLHFLFPSDLTLSGDKMAGLLCVVIFLVVGSWLIWGCADSTDTGKKDIEQLNAYE
jgi:hypothetical protein